MVAQPNVMESSGSVAGLLEAARLAVETAPSPAARLARMETLAARIADAEAARDRMYEKLKAGYDWIEGRPDADERFARWVHLRDRYMALCEALAACKGLG